jgi:hypothetical protein
LGSRAHGLQRRPKLAQWQLLQQSMYQDANIEATRLFIIVEDRAAPSVALCFLSGGSVRSQSQAEFPLQVEPARTPSVGGKR